jgi:hypothetical protein
MKYSKLNCKVKTDSKFLVNAGFMCDKAPATAAMLLENIKNMLHIYIPFRCM